MNGNNNDSLNIKTSNRFFNENVPEKNTNIDAEAKRSVNYNTDPNVKANLQGKTPITISVDGKIFIIIVILLLIYIFFLPNIYDLINS